ncbi:hypothetical protein [Maricaulis parjimensis]|uniref:hypothetical protein n=1 Tax=Maricaulis parjimensis TaxID=144023 RepID=UPI00193A8F2E|nr:hypothetical protein [Maricaulis parjimensis]
MSTAAIATRPVHIIRPSLAWLAASIASGLTLTLTFGILSLFEGTTTARDLQDFLQSLIPASLLFGTYIAAFTLLPTLVAAWLMHVLRWQAIWQAALLGGLTGAVMIQVFVFTLDAGAEGLLTSALFGGVGLVGGAVYRLVAGKH